ncbi:MAG TPA: DUF4149 domain-containing protein [Gammaproteobacteria bacterium]
MNPIVLSTLERLLTTLWVGALWAIGYLAVPILFAHLDDRMVAGALAGRMFAALSYGGLMAGGALLVIIALRAARWRRSRLLMVTLMVLLVAIGEFAIQPVMADLKSQGLVAGSAQAASFAVWHGVSAVLYLINSLLGLVVVALGNGAEVSRAAV